MFTAAGIKQGDRVVLLNDVEVIKGTFHRGTEMTIIGTTSRGYCMVDDEGNEMNDVPVFVFAKVVKEKTGLTDY